MAAFSVAGRDGMLTDTRAFTAGEKDRSSRLAWERRDASSGAAERDGISTSTWAFTAGEKVRALAGAASTARPNMAAVARDRLRIDAEDGRDMTLFLVFAAAGAGPATSRKGTAAGR